MEIKFNDPRMEELRDLFNSIGAQDAIFMNHYTLAEQTGQSPEDWKRFLQDPQVSTWIAGELELFKEYQLKQMIRNATDNEKSVGAAQMMNSLTKAMAEGKKKEGPTIIYTHVPLTPPQKDGSTVQHIELEDNVLGAIPEWEGDD